MARHYVPFERVEIFVSEVSDGNMDFRFDTFDDVLEARKKLFTGFDVKMEDTVVMKVEHGVRIVEMSEKEKGLGMVADDGVSCDALVTTQRSICLGLLTADCFPVVIVDESIGGVALVHCGWQSCDKGIVKKVIELMREKFGCDSPTLKVWIGPGIGKNSYVVEEVKQKNQDWKGLIEISGVGSFKLDLLSLIKKQLVDQGVMQKNIRETKIDTYKDLYFFSHVRARQKEMREGRFLTMVRVLY